MDKRLARKFTQALAMLCSNQQQALHHLVQWQPNNQLFVVHFGNGDHCTQHQLDSLLQDCGQSRLDLFPGLGYAFLTFQHHHDLLKLTAKCTVPDPDKQYLLGQVEAQGKHKPVFMFYSKLRKDQLRNNHSVSFPEARHSIAIDGLTQEDDFISREQEKELIDFIDQIKEWNHQNRNRFIVYGAQLSGGKEEEKVVPQVLQGLISEKGLECNQVVIREYRPGDGQPFINELHSQLQEQVTLLGLYSHTVMCFRNSQKQEHHLLANRRTALHLKGEARYGWHYGVQARKVDKVDGVVVKRQRRLTVSFRKVLSMARPCECHYPLLCDSQVHMELDGETANMLICSEKAGGVDRSIEQTYVKEVYDRIAPHFSLTRHRPWPKVEAFINNLTPHSVLLDVGCGNGKYLNIVPDSITAMGTDISGGLLGCNRHRHPLALADCVHLPIRDQCCDYVLSIAVIHHLSTPQARLQAMQEIVRVLRPQGQALVYVWAYEQENRAFTQQDVFVPWNLQTQFQEEQQSVYKRYYHVFKQGELETLGGQCEGVQVVSSFYDHGNWGVVLQKQ